MIGPLRVQRLEEKLSKFFAFFVVGGSFRALQSLSGEKKKVYKLSIGAKELTYKEIERDTQMDKNR